MTNSKQIKQNEVGSAMLITTILLLTLSVMVVAAINIAGRQYDLAVLSRNTSNTYYLARSAAEKQVDAMNKSIASEMTYVLQELSKTYINDLKNKASTISYKDSKLQVDNAIIKAALQDQLYAYIASNYVGKTMSYKATSDRIDNNYTTTITIQTQQVYQNGSSAQLDKQKFKVIVTAMTMATTGSIYDKQVVEGVIKIDLPSDISHEIHERYAWHSVAPEVFQSAILSYSDIIVSGSGALVVQSGDVRVGGPQNIKSNDGGQTYPEVDENGGVIAINGGRIDITDNLYCINNVMVTNGWSSSERNKTTSIYVGGDIIAYTVGIVDDYFSGSDNQSPFDATNQISNASITVDQNVMVDNDVMIDRWIRGSTITVGKTIFGINGGMDASSGGIDPNQSSGVFSQGAGTQIIADRMFVAGQPYITLKADDKPLKLWESIGEPFNGVASFAGYVTNTEDEANKDYLLDTSPFYEMIATDKIRTAFTQTYAVAKVSGTNTKAGTISSGNIEVNDLIKGADCKAIFGNNQAEALKFFYQGGSSHTFSEFMNVGDTTYTNQVKDIIAHTGDYYAATKDGYFRALINPPVTNYKGLRGYMTLMRAPLYEAFLSDIPTRRLFSDAVNMGRLSNNHTWSYETPIEVINTSKTIDISKFYVDENGSGAQPYSSIIINKDVNATLTLEASVGHEFKGVIISAGPVKVDDDITVTGTIIIGDLDATTPASRAVIFQGNKAGLILDTATLTVNYSPEQLLKIIAKDQSLYRTILDALYLTDYSEESLSDVMKAQAQYMKAALTYTDESVLEVDTKDVQIVIESLKKAE